eukprot:CAMPEP_0206172268 /NCGR_PEP_ID=MMETSP1474-20131121/45138_1 /ASSEMBLY_ACC=CAM_ASM_001110 /TAXON_ID=97495 /ORGANISM="Imantonia sp., Strain RCC918" /LENGTH=122 /DNA_ID=CAMNT_0053580319 /DNA_START=69 /DNA_END=435 /DNA_ORIENTATION=+
MTGGSRTLGHGTPLLCPCKSALAERLANTRSERRAHLITRSVKGHAVAAHALDVLGRIARVVDDGPDPLLLIHRVDLGKVRRTAAPSHRASEALGAEDVPPHSSFSDMAGCVLESQYGTRRS